MDRQPPLFSILAPQKFGETAVMIPPYDNVDVLSGQGTCGLEMLEQVRQALPPTSLCCLSQPVLFLPVLAVYRLC